MDDEEEEGVGSTHVRDQGSSGSEADYCSLASSMHSNIRDSELEGCFTVMSCLSDGVCEVPNLSPRCSNSYASCSGILGSESSMDKTLEDNDSDDGSLDACCSDDSRGSDSLNSLREKVQDVENPLVLNSSIAFGTNDYHDFEIDGGGGAGIVVPVEENLFANRRVGSCDDITNVELISEPTVARRENWLEPLDDCDPGDGTKSNSISSIKGNLYGFERINDSLVVNSSLFFGTDDNREFELDVGSGTGIVVPVELKIFADRYSEHCDDVSKLKLISDPSSARCNDCHDSLDGCDAHDNTESINPNCVKGKLQGPLLEVHSCVTSRSDDNRGYELDDGGNIDNTTNLESTNVPVPQKNERHQSLNDYGSGDKTKSNDGYAHKAKLQCVERINNENPSEMNSSVAFGSDDFRDFELLGPGILAPEGLNWFADTDNWNCDDPSNKVKPGAGSIIAPCIELEENVEIILNPKLDRLQEVKRIPSPSCLTQDCSNLMKKVDIPSKLYSGAPGMLHQKNEAIDNGVFHEMKRDELLIKNPLNGYQRILEGESKDAISSDFYSANDYKEDSDSPNYSTCQLPFEKNRLTSMPKGNSECRINSDATQASNSQNNEFDSEIVREMEKILLDAGQPDGPIYPLRAQNVHSNQTSLLRDGGFSASTSSIDEAFSPVAQFPKFGGVEVIGAKQKRGDVSFSERIVGVKEYTVYMIRVWNKKDSWVVERRYREFYTLYCGLKSYFADHGWTLPPSWSTIEQESWKVFGSASPEIISQRSALIQECLQSIVCSDSYPSLPRELNWFLSMPATDARSNVMTTEDMVTGLGRVESTCSSGRTISLIVDVTPFKPTKQILESQHYQCAGCHNHFDDDLTTMRGFIHKLGWGKPRLCEYSGQLFCSSCHVNEYAVLPGRVLHHWDFAQYPVCQLAKSYLDSIHEQPMLCVSAVNPFLFSKVPVLHHATTLRKRLGFVIEFVRCPFRITINKGLGSRRYLLENNEFFSLRDLIDLSRGAFSVLPVMLETALRKIIEHITEHCLVCYDVGVPCNSRQACDYPTVLIFPFQENETEKCKSCGSVYHTPCFKKQEWCSCGFEINAYDNLGSSHLLSMMTSPKLVQQTFSSSNAPREKNGRRVGK